ncbi:MAG: TetR/AcrR family transcriptional regulator [Gemmatimonadota bacterium]|nr:TetR/AcrR family transcriptional regulator [Gemmatimonadota bacterium]
MGPSSHSARSGQKAASTRRSYHHGDLRQALLSAAVDLLAERGAESLTLRAVARAAGVSQTAPYRHFTDRGALVGGVAMEAFARMGAAIERAVQKGPPGLPALKRGLAAYVRFAHQHPAEYRVMFGAELAGRHDMPELQAAARGVFSLLSDGIARLQERGLIGAGDAMLMAITAWATLHGLVMLSLDGQTAVTGRSIGTLVEAASGLLLTGMGATRATSR